MEKEDSEDNKLPSLVFKVAPGRYHGQETKKETEKTENEAHITDDDSDATYDSAVNPELKSWFVLISLFFRLNVRT